MENSREAVLSERLDDARGKQVAFVSHCLLNENVRYLGGAFRPGGVAEVIDELVSRGVGICQMPCPEQQAWGGVLKRRMLRAYGARRTALYRFRGLLLRLFMLYTRLEYWRLARRVVSQIADYERSGFTVIGIIGVGASPSCGVHTTLDLRRSFEVIANTPLDSVDRRAVNRDAVVACRVAGLRALHQVAETPASPPTHDASAARARPRRRDAWGAPGRAPGSPQPAHDLGG